MWARAAVAGALFLLGVGLGSWWSGRGRERPRPPLGAPAPVPPRVGKTPATSPPSPPQPTSERRERAVRLALVIDDLGRRPLDVDRLLALQAPLTFAVLPFETQTAEVVRLLRERQAEILVHLPMEPGGGQDPGPGALRLGQSQAELEALTERALDAVAGARGANNHMGSALSADPAAMRAILGVVGRRGLFYLDSRTSPDTVAPAVAAELGVRLVERQVFLDSTLETRAIELQFDRWLDLGRRNGTAIAIAHPHPETLEVLARRVPAARRDGFRFVPVSRLLPP